MMKPVRILAAVALAFVGISGAFAQSQSDLAATIQNRLPSTNRGQITANSIRDVFDAFNAARGKPNGLANLDAEGRIPAELTPSTLAPNKITLPSTDQGSTGNISGMTVVPNGSAVAGTLAKRLNATYALGQAGDTPDTARPTPQFLTAPVASEVLTSSALWSRVKDNPSEPHRVFAHSLTYEASTGGSAPVGEIAAERVNLYLGMRGLPGSGSIWAFNTQTHLQTGYTGPGAAGGEIDVTNSAQHRGDGFGQIPFLALNSTGLSVNAFSTYRNGQGVFVGGRTTDGGAAWNRGFVVYEGSVESRWGCAFCDYGGSYATLQSYGNHTFGLDFTNATNVQGVLGSKTGQGGGISFFKDGLPSSRIFDNGSGQIVIGGALAVSNMATSTTVAVQGSVCLDVNGQVYVKTTSGACK